MKLIQSISELREILPIDKMKVLVPTMGALHSGHASLINIARDKANNNGLVIVSIFVNPTQFDREEDLTNYPSSLDKDLLLCKEHGADIVFAPSAKEMYFPDNSFTLIESHLSQNLCGATRPGHFEGVGLICSKLFNITQAQYAVFGEKDFQQVSIIKRLVRDLNFPIKVIAAPTVREPSGLALSSRNLNLNPEEKREASQIFSALTYAKNCVKQGERNTQTLITSIKEKLSNLSVKADIDYLNIVDAETLEKVEEINTRPTVVAIAIFIGSVRLIDNIQLT